MDDADPVTFIGRFGLVRYHGHISTQYPCDWPCELGICLTRRADSFAQAQVQRRAAARRQREVGWQLARLAATDQERRQRRRELDSCRFRRRELAAEAERIETFTLPVIDMMIEQEAGPPGGHGATPVFDHCHAHGWVRGLICMACNNTVSWAEHVPGSHDGTDLTAVTAYLANCPGCAGPGP